MAADGVAVLLDGCRRRYCEAGDAVLLDGKRNGDDWLSDGYTNGEPRHDDCDGDGARVTGSGLSATVDADRYGDTDTAVPATAGTYLAADTAWPTGA